MSRSSDKATAARLAWEQENGRKAGADDWYDEARGCWTHYRDEIDRKAMTAAGVEIRVIPNAEFVSTSLPRNYTLHKERGGRCVDAPGTPEHGSVIIESRRQLHDLVRAGNDRGEAMIYGGPGGDIMPD